MTAPVPEDKLRLGGMALRNGLLVHGPTHWAAAVRTDDGELKVASGRKPDLGAKAAVALVSVAPALMALRSGDLAAYHGVEHKAIAAYEDDSDAADATKEHDRCGSHLVAPMLAAAAVGNVAARRAGLRGPAAEAAVGLGG